jgi:hypothetical protein
MIFRRHIISNVPFTSNDAMQLPVKPRGFFITC